MNNKKKILSSLEQEHNFEFSKNDVPEKLKDILIEIENNKRKWKSLYMAVWGLPLYFLTPFIINKGKGDEIRAWGLPAAKLKAVLYTPNELKNYLTHYDREIHISQVIKIFILLENYFFKYHGLTKEPTKKGLTKRIIEFIPLPGWIKNKLKAKEPDLTNFRTLKHYLKDKKFASDTELKELELAKETRNSFVHRRGLINQRWLKIYKKTGRKHKYNVNDEVPLPLPFGDIEDWSNLLVKIIENSIQFLKKSRQNDQK